MFFQLHKVLTKSYFCCLCLFVFSSLFVLLSSRKRKESEPRTKCLLNNADITPHHPTDPVEMRRINFQTPGRRKKITTFICETKNYTQNVGYIGKICILVKTYVGGCRFSSLNTPLLECFHTERGSAGTFFGTY